MLLKQKMESEKNFDRAIETIKKSDTLAPERPEYWINNTKIGFPEWVYKTFKTDSDAGNSKLLFHQRLIQKYLQPDLSLIHI